MLLVPIDRRELPPKPAPKPSRYTLPHRGRNAPWSPAEQAALAAWREKPRKAVVGRRKYPWRELAVGECFIMPAKSTHQVSGQVNVWRNKLPDRIFITRFIPGEGVMVLRVDESYRRPKALKPAKPAPRRYYSPCKVISKATTYDWAVMEPGDVFYAARHDVLRTGPNARRRLPKRRFSVQTNKLTGISRVTRVS